MIKALEDKKSLSVTRKVTQRLISQKAIRKKARKIKVVIIIPDLVDSVNQASMISEIYKGKRRIPSPY